MPALSTYPRVTGQWATDILELAGRIGDFWRGTTRAEALATARREVSNLQQAMAKAPSLESANAMHAAAQDAAYRYPLVEYAREAADYALHEMLAAQTRERLLANGLREHEIMPICERRPGYLPPRWRMTP